MKKIFFLVIVICFFVFGYLVIKGSGNTWGCKNGEWIKFGYLDKAQPDKPCGVIDTIKGNILTFTENYRKGSRLLNTEKYGNQGLEKVPPELIFMIDTVVVELDRNKLSTLPNDFFDLVNLKELLLDHNNFSYIPPGIKSFTKLEKLDLSHNQITEIPKEFGELKSLRRLDLSRNNISEFPDEFFNLKDNLENLDIFGNKFNTDDIILLQEKLPNTTINF
ncbi:MAG: leucine-rich repeat domain-containing protein [bacterium]|nr:leucine-rich repeat domain-containing protein [bacterium]